MQVASVGKNGPWIATVYFVPDAQQNLYWLSLPSRRHSQELYKDARAAIAIAIKDDQPVIGLQAEGNVEVLKDEDEIRKVMDSYVTKYGAGKDFYDNFVAGKNQHNLYKFVPKSFVLFDEVNFAGEPRQEWKLK